MKHNSVRNDRRAFKSDEEVANHRRACMIDKWMEKKTTITHHHHHHNKSKKKPSSDYYLNPRLNSTSNSSSSPSSNRSSPNAEPLPVPQPKPVRTGCTARLVVKSRVERRANSFSELGSNNDNSSRGPKKGGGRFSKAKSRALKIYGDFKEPISPGGKFAAFLNSFLFGGGEGNNQKKKKMAKVVANYDDSPSLKTSGGKVVDGVKRSVRFDEDSKSYGPNRGGQKSENTWKKSINCHEELIMECVMDGKNRTFDGNSSEEEDDAESYASSDLFELDNLWSIGLMEGSYGDELPVYETTCTESSCGVICA